MTTIFMSVSRIAPGFAIEARSTFESQDETGSAGVTSGRRLFSDLCIGGASHQPFTSEIANAPEADIWAGAENRRSGQR
jgi:hypothetical protein